MSEKYETYYVPEQSKFPLLASIGLFTTVFGLGNLLMTLTDLRKSGLENTGQTTLPTIIFIMGLGFFCTVLWNWFATAMKENRAGMNSAQLKRSYVQGMYWFIFSEVMFFSAFFGALFYIRTISLPHIAGGPTGEILWPGFSAEWPLMVTPDVAANADKASVVGPEQNMSFPGLSGLFGWLPFWNTVLLITSSFTAHFAHSALKKGNNKTSFNAWLSVTVALGVVFLVLQAEEYVHAYHHMGLTLDSGVYGTTFFMLTGFHGLHVTLGAFMLLVQLNRSVLLQGRIIMIAALLIGIALNLVLHLSLTMRIVIMSIACAVMIGASLWKPSGSFDHHDCFGFEASSWYWHFVDVVWIGLFLVVYIFG